MFKFGMPTLVVRTFNVDESAADGKYLEIVGRASGFVSWILTLLKLDPQTSLQLERDRLSVKSSSLSGETHTVMPLGAIESTQCGFSKSLIWFTLGALILIGGIVSSDGGTFLVSLVIAAVFFLIYFFSGRMFITVAAGGTSVAIAYKKGMVEGVSVDLARTLSAIDVLNALIVKEHAK